jgi:hypothetical protein
MRKPTPAEMQKAMSAFFIMDEEPALTVLDRSTLENWSLCPFRASAQEAGKINFPAVLHTGNEVHDALSRVTRNWIESDGEFSPVQLRDELLAELRGSRPDLQPQVLEACRASAWNWASYLAANCHPGNILGFDGGEEIGKSGQLACDFEDLGVQVTSELDLLHAGPSEELLHETDYKSGHKFYTVASVAEAFQFQLHAVLVFANYPKVRGLEVTVLHTRTGQRSYRVVFDRKKVGDYTARIRMAVQAWATHRDNPPTWPTWEKCSTCEAAFLCPSAGQDIGDVARDPEGVLRQLVAAEAKRKAMVKTLAAHVDRTGKDIVADGVAFGRHKPKSDRKATAVMYEVDGEDGE